MAVLSRSLLLASTVALVACLLPGGRAAADEKDVKKVPIPTVDGVDLQGTYYPPAGNAKDACVLLLHNVSLKGGNSHQDGWDGLAERLQKEGYAVLSFDFRGFGGSTTVDPAKFWKAPHNAMNLKGAGLATPPATIDQKTFPPGYYPYLLNDIAAARAFLNRKNDARELNSSNIIVIGAGEGATLGALWMASECHLQKDKASLGPIPRPPMLDDPEGKDLVCGVWLSISPSLAGRPMPVKSSLTTAVGLKVPQAFIYGKSDEGSRNYAEGCIATINPKKEKGLTATFAPTTELRGSKLLNEKLKVEGWIASTCLPAAADKHGNREWKKRDADKYGFLWTFPRTPVSIAKRPTEEFLGPIPLDRLGLGR
jgi:hypothetical protein